MGFFIDKHAKMCQVKLNCSLQKKKGEAMKWYDIIAIFAISLIASHHFIFNKFKNIDILHSFDRFIFFFFKVVKVVFTVNILWIFLFYYYNNWPFIKKIVVLIGQTSIVSIAIYLIIINKINNFQSN